MQIFLKSLKLEIQPPYGRLHSSSCGGLQPLVATEGPLGPNDDYAGRADGRTDGRATGLRELKNLYSTCKYILN